MKYLLLVVSLLQGAAGQDSTTAAPTPGPTSAPSPSPGVATIKGQIKTSFGSCANAKKCTNDNPTECKASAKSALVTRSTVPANTVTMDPLATKSCRRRLSEMEETAKVFGAEIKFDFARRLDTSANVDFGYTITTTNAQADAMNAKVTNAKNDLTAFATALKTALAGSGVAGLEAIGNSNVLQVTGVTSTVTKGPTSTTPQSAVSAAVNSKRMLSALALLLGFLW